MIQRLNDERGVAMVMALMIAMIVVIFSITVVQLSMHNSGSSALDRKRVDAVSTAEAGLDAPLSQVQTSVIDASAIAGSLYAQGSVSVSNSCTFIQDLYAKGAVTMTQTGTVGHDVISATSSLSMSNNTHISHNVTVGTTCSGCTTGVGGRVSGTVTTGHISPAPPPLAMPQIDFVQSAWVAAGYSIVSYSSCSSAHTALLTGWAAPTVVRITPACSLTFSGD